MRLEASRCDKARSQVSGNEKRGQQRTQRAGFLARCGSKDRVTNDGIKDTQSLMGRDVAFTLVGFAYD